MNVLYHLLYTVKKASDGPSQGKERKNEEENSMDGETGDGCPLGGGGGRRMRDERMEGWRRGDESSEDWVVGLGESTDVVCWVICSR